MLVGYQSSVKIPLLFLYLGKNYVEKKPGFWNEKKPGFAGVTGFLKQIGESGFLKAASLWTVIFSTAIVVFSTIALRYFGVFEKAELQTFDQMLQLRPKEEVDSRLLVVEITEKDIQTRTETTTGPKSISDNTLAQLLNKLQKHQPPVIGLDIYRDFADPVDKSKSIQLTTELSKENIVVICKGRDGKYDPQGVKPPAGVPVERQGFTDAIEDLYGIIRRQILIMPQEPSSPCTTPNSLSLQLAAGYLSSKNIKTELSEDEDYIKFGSEIFYRLKHGRSGGYQQGVDLNGIQVPIDYRNADFDRVSLEDVLTDKVNPESLKNRVILIGVTANTLKDTWSTPYSTAQQPYQEVPGVIVHAQMVSQILSAVLDDRPLLWVLPDWGDILWIWGWSLGSGLVVWRVRTILNKGCATVVMVTVLYGVCAIVLCASGSIVLFIQGAWLPFIPSAFAVVVSGGVVLLIQNRP